MSMEILLVYITEYKEFVLEMNLYLLCNVAFE